MTREAAHLAGWDTSTSAGGLAQEAAARPASNEVTLDQLLAEPIVKQLMRRDQTDEATIRDLLLEIAASRLALRANDGQCHYAVNDVAAVLELGRPRDDDAPRRSR
jgi:hypothetical protein